MAAGTPSNFGPINLPGGSELYLLNQNDTSLSTGNGDFVVAAFGTGDTLTVGNGNSTIFAMRGNATITVGSGSETVLAGTQSTVTVGSNPGGTEQSLVSVGGNSSATVGDGKNIVFAGGQGDTVTTGTGTDVVYDLGAGKHTINFGNGNNWAYLHDCNNVVNDGSGTDVAWLGGDDNTAVMNAAGGTDFLFTFCNQDTLDLSKILAGVTVTPTVASLSSYVTLTETQDVQFPGLMDSLLTITGPKGTANVTLLDYNAGGLQNMLNHNIFVLPK